MASFPPASRQPYKTHTDQDKRLLSLRTQDGQTITVPRDHVEEMQKSSRSRMPEKLMAPPGRREAARPVRVSAE